MYPKWHPYQGPEGAMGWRSQYTLLAHAGVGPHVLSLSWHRLKGQRQSLAARELPKLCVLNRNTFGFVTDLQKEAFDLGLFLWWVVILMWQKNHAKCRVSKPAIRYAENHPVELEDGREATVWQFSSKTLAERIFNLSTHWYTFWMDLHSSSLSEHPCLGFILMRSWEVGAQHSNLVQQGAYWASRDCGIQH